MKRTVACRNRRRTAIVLAAAAALIVAGGGSALAAPGQAAARAQAATSCTVHWVGRVFPYDWTTAKNWSTGKVPGPAAGRPLATTIGRYFGRFAATVTIPAGATAGQHKLIAVGSNGNRAEATITVS